MYFIYFNGRGSEHFLNVDAEILEKNIRDSGFPWVVKKGWSGNQLHYVGDFIRYEDAMKQLPALSRNIPQMERACLGLLDSYPQKVTQRATHVDIFLWCAVVYLFYSLIAFPMT